jgi:hypothetical protein
MTLILTPKMSLNIDIFNDINIDTKNVSLYLMTFLVSILMSLKMSIFNDIFGVNINVIKDVYI